MRGRVYHVILKQHNSIKFVQSIFKESCNKRNFLRMLQDEQAKANCSVISFVIMDTHIHLLLKTKTEAQLLKVITKLKIRYARLYNRDKSKILRVCFEQGLIYFEKKTLEWQLNTILYILNNPIESKITNNRRNYVYSSYNLMFGNKTSISSLISLDTDYFNSLSISKEKFMVLLSNKLKEQQRMYDYKYNR